MPVFTSWDQLDIPDLTDQERKAFAAALADDIAEFVTNEDTNG